MATARCRHSKIAVLCVAAVLLLLGWVLHSTCCLSREAFSSEPSFSILHCVPIPSGTYMTALRNAYNTYPASLIMSASTGDVDNALQAFPPFHNLAPATNNARIRSSNFHVTITDTDLALYGAPQVKKLLWVAEATLAILQLDCGFTFGESANLLRGFLIELQISNCGTCATTVDAGSNDIALRITDSHRDITTFHSNIAHEVFHIIQRNELVLNDNPNRYDWDHLNECTANVVKVIFNGYKERDMSLAHMDFPEQGQHKLDIRRTPVYANAYNKYWYWAVLIRDHGLRVFGELMNTASPLPNTILERLARAMNYPNTLELMARWCQKYVYYAAKGGWPATQDHKWYDVILPTQSQTINDLEFYGFLYIKTQRSLTITIEGTQHAVCCHARVEQRSGSSVSSVSGSTTGSGVQFQIPVANGETLAVGLTSVKTLQYSPPTDSVTTRPVVRIDTL